MSKNKLASLFLKPFLYVGSKIPLPQIYGPTLLLAVLLRDLNTVSYITKNQNIYAIPKKINLAIAKNSLVDKNEKSKVVSFSGSSDEKIKLNNAILDKLISSDGGGIFYPISRDFNAFQILINYLVYNKNEDKIYDLFVKNKSTINNGYIAFVILVYSTYQNFSTSDFSNVVNKVYDFIKKDGIGDELISLSYIRLKTPKKYQDNLFAYCLSKAPDGVLIDMLSSMKPIDFTSPSRQIISSLSNREKISPSLLHSILKKGFKEEDILRCFANLSEDTSIEYYHEYLRKVRPDVINSLNRAKVLLDKEVFENELKKTQTGNHKEVSIKVLGSEKKTEVINNNYFKKRKRQFKI